MKPAIPRKLQILLRRLIARRNLVHYSHLWPIEPESGTPPSGWKGWPENKRFALVLTHDVETAMGHEKTKLLAGLEKGLGFRSSFNFVPKRYHVQSDLRRYLTDRGFEVGVHGLYHDGRYYTSRAVFRSRAVQINSYLKEWEAVGFRSPSMLHNLAWIHDLNIEYDASTFDTDPFEPQPDGMGTIFPFRVQDNLEGKGYIELPYTLPQDFTLFIVLQEKGITIWKEKLSWIARMGGMALMNVHPDYMTFEGKKSSKEEYPAEYYKRFLIHIKDHYAGQYWHTLPRDLARFWAREREPVSISSTRYRTNSLDSMKHGV